ncbi:DUF6862 domain-containing protein [Trinickia acidisoli]|uniref:DUF6862 domain-containing protein n=1 Tax=Trinickia acidisoli TaxID=2767482 RepID=UPI001A905E22|nr:hypothetical protein [Trinickia acidisoli]
MTTMASGLIAGALGANAQGAATSAENETLNNWLNHVRPQPMSLSQAEQYQQAVDTGDSSQQDQLAALSAQNDQSLAQACAGGTGSAGCQAQIQAAQAGGNLVYTQSLGSGLNYTYANPLSYAMGPESFPSSLATGPQLTSATSGSGPSVGAATLDTMLGSPLAGAFGGLVYATGGSNASAYSAAQMGLAVDGVLAGSAGYQMPEAPTLGATDSADYSGIGATGQVGEQYLQSLGGQSQVYFSTSLGGRYVDQLVDGVANESKVGYTSLTSSVQTQIAKDAELMNSGAVNGVNWHFFTSPVTGLGGPSQPLLNTLQGSGIGVIIH